MDYRRALERHHIIDPNPAKPVKKIENSEKGYRLECKKHYFDAYRL
jgi:hypothetical protein